MCLIPSLQWVVASGGSYGCLIYLSNESQHYLGLFTGRQCTHTLILGHTGSLPPLPLSLAICLSVSAPPPPCVYLCEVSCGHVRECVEVRGQPQVFLLRLSQPYVLKRSLSGLELNKCARLAGQCLHFPEITNMSTICGFLNVGLGIKFRSSCFCGKDFTN